MPTGLLLPYRASRVIPATIVGRAKGRSMRALTTRLPGNSSRTSTQATTVPIPAFPAATASATAKVRRRAARAWGWVAAAQNAPQPSRPERQTTAVRGRTTTRLRYRVTVPRSSAAPPRTSSPIRRPLTTLVANRDADLLLDVGHDPGLLVEELLGHLRPATQLLDGEQPRRLGEVGGRRDLLVDRPIALLDEDLLRLGRAQVVDERLGLLRVLALGHDRDRVLDQDRLIGHHVVDVLVLLLGGDGLVLIGQHHVALAANKGLQGLPGRLVLHRHVAEQLLQVGHGLLGRLALLELGAVGRHHVPAGPTRGERVGGDALVAVGVPVLGDQAGLDQLGHVRLQRQGHHVARQPVLDRAGLVARAAVGLADPDALASVGLLERRDEGFVRLPGGRVGNQGQLVAAAARAARPAATGRA